MAMSNLSDMKLVKLIVSGLHEVFKISLLICLATGCSFLVACATVALLENADIDIPKVDKYRVTLTGNVDY